MTHLSTRCGYARVRLGVSVDPTLILLLLALVVGVYMAWNIGANDVANAMGTSVGSHALTIRQAVIVAAIFEFAGAFLVGGQVTGTIKKGIIDPGLFAAVPQDFALGMTASLLAAALFLQIASFRGLPVSTTHSIVGAVLGFGVVSQGFDAVKWNKLGAIVGSWFVSPLMGGVLGFLVFWVIRKQILDSKQPLDATRRWGPLLVFGAGAVLMLTMLYKGLKNLKLDIGLWGALGLASLAGAVFALIAVFIVRNMGQGAGTRATQLQQVERIFAWLQILTACFMAFAHGSNDVANAIGPAAGVWAALKEGTVAASSRVPLWLLGIGGVGIVVGLATYGKKVIETVGKNITEITPTRGFAAEFGAAATVLIGSRLGLPLSTTHVLVGAVIGVGMARGIAALNMRVIKGIATSWVLTVPAAAVASAVIYKALTWVF